MNNKNKTFLMLSIMSMMLVPGGIIPVHAIPGDLLLTINNPTPEIDDFFGVSVATTPTGNLLVSAHGDDTGATNAGSVYLFDGDDGSLLLTINNPEPEEYDYFGNSVTTTNTGDLLIGAYGDDAGAIDAGLVYLFDGTDGSLLLTINNPTPEIDDFFGQSVAVTNTGDLLIGTNGDDAGSAYLFDGISSDSTSTTGTVEILPTCGVQFNSGAPINYGVVLPMDTSDEQIITLYNSGNVAGNILVSGSNWIDNTSSIQMNVGDTKYSTISDDYSSKTPLQLIDETLLTLEPQVNTDTFWQLQANLLDSLFSGSLTQTVDFGVTC